MRCPASRSVGSAWSGRDDAGAGGDVSGLARLPGAGIVVPGWAVLSGSGQSWAEFWRDVWCGLRGVRAAEFRDAGGDTEGDCYADGGGGEATLDAVVAKPRQDRSRSTFVSRPAHGHTSAS